MRIVIILFSLFSSVQDMLDTKAKDTRRISVYAACFYLELLNHFAKKAIRLIKNVLSNLPQLTIFYRLILKNPDL
jgi:hypothetical protein